MSGASQMPSVRRRMPGMTNQSHAAELPADITSPVAPAAEPAAEDPGQRAPESPVSEGLGERANPRSERATRPGPRAGRTRADARRLDVDYASTRLVNFRIPVDLHDRYRALVHEVESSHPRLRRPSFTEVVTALLAEGPETSDEVAELIRRKRAAEHGLEV